jgi:hypothetical protein
MKIKHCQWCDKQFETSISYQIYCAPECREHATKEKIAQRYIISRRAKRSGKRRLCNSCGVALSIYNDETLCAECLVSPDEVKRALKDIKGLSNGKP